MWKEITGPIKRFAGTAASVTIPRGSVLLHLRAVGNGTIQGIPDGQGGSVTITIPNTTQWFEYDPQHLNCVFADPTNKADWVVDFVGTTAYFIEVMGTGAGF